VTQLPEPRTDGGTSLERALASRRSVREFTSQTLTLEEVSQLLWAARGITASWGGRTAPSAGALYPLEVYVATADRLLHYLPEGHRAEVVASADLRSALAAAAYGQAAVAQAPAVFAITAVPARTAAKYGERAERYVQLEAGHAAQNLLLQAVALGLAGVPMGAFDDEKVERVLELPSGCVPLYLIPVGHAAGA
jgi:SagB-type dehydrogenase family enzyme